MNNPPSTYEALNYDGTERRANYRFVSYRIDILHILGKKEAAAIIFEILYRWETDVHCKRLLKEIETRKKAGLPPLTEEEVADQMWTYMSYNDFVRESGSALGYNTVIRMLNYLIEEKIIEQRENHDPRYADYEYRINKEVVRKLLKELPVSPVFAAKIPKKKKDSTQMGIPNNGSTQMGIPGQKSTQMGIGSTQMGTEVYPNGGTSHIHTENSQNEGKNGNPNESTTETLHSSTPSLSSLAEKSEKLNQLIEEARQLQEEIRDQAISEDVEHLSTSVDNPVEKQASSDLPIATATNLDSVTTRNTPNTPNMSPMPDLPVKPTQRNTEPLQLADEELRIQGYWCQLGYLERPSAKVHWATLSKHLKSFEEMESLFKYTQAALKDKKDKRVYPGNLVDHLDGWKQEERRKQALQEKPTSTRSTVDPIKKYTEIGKKFMMQGAN